jgi:hypothetical protein
MTPFLLDEVPNDVIDGLSQEFPISQYTPDRLRDPAQTFGAFPMIGSEIADPPGRGGIAHLQLFEYYVLQRMMADIGIDLEISDNRVDDLVVRALSASEEAQLPLKNQEQRFVVAVLFAQNIDDHCALPEDKFL